MLSENVTFSIFLCGCKLSGTHGSSNLSTLSAAKVHKRDGSFCVLSQKNYQKSDKSQMYTEGTVPFAYLIVIITGIVGVDHSSVGEYPGRTEVVCLVDVIFQSLISVGPDR